MCTQQPPFVPMLRFHMRARMKGARAGTGVGVGAYMQGTSGACVGCVWGQVLL